MLSCPSCGLHRLINRFEQHPQHRFLSRCVILLPQEVSSRIMWPWHPAKSHCKAEVAWTADRIRLCTSVQRKCARELNVTAYCTVKVLRTETDRSRCSCAMSMPCRRRLREYFIESTSAHDSGRESWKHGRMVTSARKNLLHALHLILVQVGFREAVGDGPATHKTGAGRYTRRVPACYALCHRRFAATSGKIDHAVFNIWPLLEHEHSL